MTDLVYFGYVNEKGSKALNDDFIEEIQKKFPDVVLKDAYSNIKGYRQAVYMPEGRDDEYFVWALSHGWLHCSINLEVMMGVDKERFVELFNKAKKEYPECFKKGAKIEI